MEKINVEQIMQEIRAEIKEKGLETDLPAFKDIPFSIDSQGANGDIDQVIERLGMESTIEYYYDMPKGIRSIVKKVIRRSIHFVFFPVLASQNRFNADVAYSMRMLRRNEKTNRKELLERLEKLERENRILKRKLGK